MKLTLRLLLMAAMGTVCMWAQKGGSTGTTGGGTSSGGTTGGATGGTTGSPTGAPTSMPPINSNPTPAPTVPPPQRPIFLSGTVVLDDGSRLPGSVNIQSICSGQQKIVAHTSASGDFGFQWGANAGSIFEDASENVHSVGSSFGNGLGGGSSSGQSGQSTSAAPASRMNDPLADCDLRVDLAGYTSTRVSLFNRTSFDNADIGSIVLHRITGDEGRVVSMLSLKAPRDAKKNFDKGTELARANKPGDAVASFQKAVTSYPQYADAWLGLGRAETQMGDHDAARSHFQKALDLDDKLVGPWQELGFLASDAGRWEDAARYLDQAVKLDPMDSAMAWYFSGMANYNLGRFDAAERSVRAEMKLDQGRNPRADYLLGLVLIARKDFAGGADELRRYIAVSPGAKDVETARQQLARAENQLHK